MYSIETLQILLIEDNPGDSRLIQEYLKEPTVTFRPEIKVSKDLQSGINRLSEDQYDIILLDLSLPDSLGLETLEKVKSAAGSLPIVVLTGLDDEELGFEAVQKGAQDFLIKKEIDATLLSRALLYAIQRSRLTRELEESKERLQQAQQLAKLGNFEQDLKTGDLIWSKELFRIFDMDPEGEEPSFEQLLDILHPKDRNRTIFMIEKVREEAQSQYLEARIHTQSGNNKWIHNIIYPIKNKSGEVVKIFGTTHDITRRKQAEQQLRENEQRYRMLFQAGTDEILVFQLDENLDPRPFMEVNNVACDMLGYSREELLQKTLYDIIAADKEDIKKRISEVVAFGEKTHETKHLTKGGNIIPLEISARSFLYKGRQTMISIGRDIRERHKLEQEILNISERERQRIGRDMHDDLGQMLTGIGMITRNLANQLKANGLPKAEKVLEIANMIKEADEHARSLARGLVPVNVESNGLNNALEELTSRNSKIYDIDICYLNDQADEIKNSSSKVHLYRIAQEAINNAVKHGKATSIDVVFTADSDYLMLRIRDNGKGFSGSRSKSNGMGLRIMNFRTSLIGGSLEIDSEKGVGTEIICKVPQKDTPQ